MIKKALLYLIVSAVLLELLLAGGFYVLQRSWSSQVSPQYPWSTYTSSGKRLGRQSGYLKLELRPFITYGNVPNQETPYFRINSNGYRGKELVTNDVPGDRIVLVGGSAAFGTGLHSDAETLAAQLEPLVGAEVVNAAVIGHQSGQELVYLTTELVDLQPDHIIAYDGWNDFMQSIWKNRATQIGDVGFYQIENQLAILTDSTAPNPFTRLIHGLPGVLFPTITRGIETALNDQKSATFTESATRETVAAYIDTITKMHRTATSNNANFLVVIQADKRSLLRAAGTTLKDPAAKNLAEQYDLFRSEAAHAFKTLQINYIDLNDYWEQLPIAHFMDNVHLNAEGNRIVAELIAAVMKSNTIGLAQQIGTEHDSKQ